MNNRQEYYKEYYLKNKDKKIEQSKEYNIRNEDKYKIYQKEYKLKNKDKAKEYHLNNKDKAKDSKLKRKYGITLNDYNAMRKQQNYRCAIPACNKHESEFKYGLCVDHNHTTDKVRELLCGNCNTIFGKAREDINILYGLIDYAIKHNKIEYIKEENE